MKEPITDTKRNKIGYIDRQLNGKCVISDKLNRKLGELRPNGHKLDAFDKMGRKLGYWDENTDTTHDRTGKKLCKGNALIGLFFD